MSFHDEIEALLRHSLEQTPAAHEAMTAGQTVIDTQRALEFFADVIAAQGTALRKIAAEIDNLRAATQGG